MIWIVGLVIAFWGLPLLAVILLGVAWMLSPRTRAALARVIGIGHAEPGRTAPAHVTLPHDEHPR